MTTAYDSSAAATRLGVHSLDHFAVQVPDLAKASDFFEAFGLDVRAAADGLDLLAFGSDHRWVKLLPGSRKALAYLSFGIYPGDLERFRQHLADMGVEPAQVPAGTSNDSLWIRDPHGVLIELRVADKCSPDNKSAATIPLVRLRGAPMRQDTGRVRPTRLSHALFFTPDIEASIRFYSEAFGLRLSDHPGPVCFLHGVHGSDHHMIAFAESSTGAGYHHSAWDVASFDEVGLGAMQMADRGYAEGWGVGRHVLGSNYFFYVRDPWGSYAEYSFDIDYIPKGVDWEASYPSPENSIYLWGPDLPHDFITNFEIEPAEA